MVTRMDSLDPTLADTEFSILVVDDQASVRSWAVAELQRMAGFRVVQADSGASALALFAQHRPSLVLLDIQMPDMDGYEVARRMRDTEAGDWTPIIFLSAMDSDLDVWRGIESGGDDYLVKPIRPVVLGAKIRAMRRLLEMRQRLVELSRELDAANRRLNRMVELDPLTQLVNRRGLDRLLHDAIRTGQAAGTPLTLALIDVDHFKAYNDTYGHAQGDHCLKTLARLFMDVCQRGHFTAARYGGEEFALILPNTPRSGAMTFARALMHLLSLQALAHKGSPVSPHVTISGGITTVVPDELTTAEGLLMRADEALYAAKSQGRNRFFSFEIQMDTHEQLRER
jgi:diguanylate cyclase (GGDEF)-like protein